MIRNEDNFAIYLSKIPDSFNYCPFSKYDKLFSFFENKILKANNKNLLVLR